MRKSRGGGFFAWEAEYAARRYLCKRIFRISGTNVRTAMGTVGAFYDALIVKSMPGEGVQTEEAVEPERFTVEGKDYLA